MLHFRHKKVHPTKWNNLFTFHFFIIFFASLSWSYFAEHSLPHSPYMFELTPYYSILLSASDLKLKRVDVKPLLVWKTSKMFFFSRAFLGYLLNSHTCCDHWTLQAHTGGGATRGAVREKTKCFNLLELKLYIYPGQRSRYSANTQAGRRQKNDRRRQKERRENWV